MRGVPTVAVDYVAALRGRPPTVRLDEPHDYLRAERTQPLPRRGAAPLRAQFTGVSRSRTAATTVSAVPAKSGRTTAANSQPGTS